VCLRVNQGARSIPIHPTATPVARPQPQPLHQPITTAPTQLNDPTRQTSPTNQTNHPGRTRHNVRHVRVLAVRNRRRAPIHSRRAKRKGNSPTARVTPCCAPADPAVKSRARTRARRGEATWRAGDVSLRRRVPIREYEGEYEGGLWVHVLRRWVPRVCVNVSREAGECLVTKAGRTLVRRGTR
jgi:hypothetical protein